MRSCAGAGGRQGEGGERVTRRPPPPTRGSGRAARGKLSAPLPARCRPAGELPENSVGRGGRAGPAPTRPARGPAPPPLLGRGRRGSGRCGQGAAPHPSVPSRPPPAPGRCLELPRAPGGRGKLPTRGARARALHPRGGTLPTSPGPPRGGSLGKEAAGAGWAPRNAGRGSAAPWDAAPCEQPRARVLTWRKAWRESFRRTATAAMATAPGARGRRRGTAEAWRRRGEDEELPSFLLSLSLSPLPSDLFASVPVPPPRAARSPRTV